MKWTPQADGASPVIMVRSLPQGTTEQELMAWAKGFVYEPRDVNGIKVGAPRYAECVKALVLHDRMLGFVQFSDIWAARTAMSQFMYDPPSIVLRRADGSHPLNLVYSDKPEIKAQNRGRQAPLPQPVYTNSRLLLVVLKELSQMVTIDELFWIFSQVSKVEKISSFTKDHKNQIVVQFETPEGATAAMDYFNGKYLPAMPSDNTTIPLCFLAIVPSKLSELTFRNQDGRNRDYTEANKLVSDLISTTSGRPIAAQQLYTQICECTNMSCRRPLCDFIWGRAHWGEGWLCPKQDDSCRGRVPIAPPTDKSSQGQVGECMHISGLPSDDSLTADHLWTLCGMYGKVKAVKMLFKYRGCVVVQFADPSSCASAIKHLHGLEFKGRTWDAKISRQPNATHWNGASDDLQKRMVSATDGIPHAPCSPESATYPSRALLLWDVPPQVTPHFVSLTISSLANCVPSNVTMGKVQGTMLVQLDSVDAALMVAMLANGKVVTGWEIKLRFDPESAAVPPAAAFFRMSSAPLNGSNTPPAMQQQQQHQQMHPHHHQQQQQYGGGGAFQTELRQQLSFLQQQQQQQSSNFTTSPATLSLPTTPPAPPLMINGDTHAASQGRHHHQMYHLQHHGGGGNAPFSGGPGGPMQQQQPQLLSQHAHAYPLQQHASGNSNHNNDNNINSTNTSGADMMVSSMFEQQQQQQQQHTNGSSHPHHNHHQQQQQQQPPFGAYMQQHQQHLQHQHQQQQQSSLAAVRSAFGVALNDFANASSANQGVIGGIGSSGPAGSAASSTGGVSPQQMFLVRENEHVVREYHLNPAQGVLDDDDDDYEDDIDGASNGDQPPHPHHQHQHHGSTDLPHAVDADDDLLHNDSDLTSPISPATPNTLAARAAGAGGAAAGGAGGKKDKPRPPGIPRPPSKPSSVKSEGTPTTSPGLIMFKHDTAPRTAQAFNPAQGTSSPWGTPVHGTTPATCRAEPTDSTFTSRLQTV